MRTAQRAGARVLGYVHTTYGARPAGDVVADIDRYASWYGVDGIFLDEAAHDAARVGYYAALGRHVRAGGAPRVLVLNPGVVPAREYFDLADVIVTFEGPYAAYGAAMDATPDWVRDQPPGRVAHLVYDASRQQAMAAVSHPQQAGYLYATSGSMPDPWRTVPVLPARGRARPRGLRVSAAIVHRGRRHDDPAAAADPRRRARRRERRARRSADLRRGDRRARDAATGRTAVRMSGAAAAARRPYPSRAPSRTPHAPSPFGRARDRVGARALRGRQRRRRDRHRDLYDAEYVKQLDRVDALRRTIGTRLALAGEPHQPSEPDPSEELDA